MRKRFEAQVMYYTMPVYIIGTYEKDITYAPTNHSCLVLGEKAGQVFHDGLSLK